MSSKTAYARTYDEVDEALKSADRVIVEGDPPLLNYARAKVAMSQEGSFQPPASLTSTMAGGAYPASAPSPRAKSFSRGPIVALVLGLIAIALVVGAATLFATRGSPPAPAPRPAVSSPSSAPDETASTARPRPDAASDLPQPTPPPAPEAAPEGPNLIGLAWPLVALAAIVLMYLLARQALSLGSDVRLEWRVTKQASGRLVISKQRSRTGRKPPGKTPATA